MAIIIATEYHLGLLKAKLARYRSQLLDPPKSAGAGKVSLMLRDNDSFVKEDAGFIVQSSLLKLSVCVCM